MMARKGLKFATIDSPCKDCENRHIGCHSECVLYKDFEVKRNEIYKNNLKEFDANRMTKAHENRVEFSKKMKSRNKHWV